MVPKRVECNNNNNNNIYYSPNSHNSSVDFTMNTHTLKAQSANGKKKQ